MKDELHVGLNYDLSEICVNKSENSFEQDDEFR